MDIHLKKHRESVYEGYIDRCRPEAAAIGRREPYHLTYVKKYGQIKCTDKKCTDTGAEQ